MRARREPGARRWAGRGRARLPTPRMRPSRSGSSAAASSDSLRRRNRPGVREDRDVEAKPGEVGLARAAESAGRRSPPATVLATASSMSGRRGAGEPMQPRSRPPSVSVTKVARQGESAG